MKKGAAKTSRLMSLYPLKFEEVISDVLKVRPEPSAIVAEAGAMLKVVVS